MHVIKISVSLSTKQSEWPIMMIFAITQLVHEFWPQKKKSEGKDDEN